LLFYFDANPKVRIYGLFIKRGIGSVLAEGTFKPWLPAQITLPFIPADR
jgi:hypothetical protein